MLDSPAEVARALLTYVDWWQPTTASVLRATPSRRRREHSDGFREGLLDTLDERSELSRRMSFLEERDRHLLFRWYVQQLSVADIARELEISRRQCFRLRTRSIRTLVDLGRPDEAA